MKKPGTLYLIPNEIAEGTQSSVIPSSVRNAIQALKFFLAEDVRTARRYFSSMNVFESIEALHFSVLNKDTSESDLPELLKPLLDGNDMGVISESGCPGVADPGALAVGYAHRNNIKVVPLVGPSSILLALMASGLNGQQFCFNGYLPIEAAEAAKSIKQCERESQNKRQTQIYIETPFRNRRLLDLMLLHLQPSTRLCVAVDLNSSQEKIISRPVAEWRLAKFDIPKAPAIFLFLA